MQNLSAAVPRSGGVEESPVATNDSDVLIFNDLGHLVSALGGDDTVSSGAGQDTIYGGPGNDLLDAGAGDDVLDGGAGDDTLLGAAGEDRLNGREGADRMEGGENGDLYYIDDVGDQVIETGNFGIDKVYSAISYTLAPRIETLVLLGSVEADGTGNELDNYMLGSLGNNVLRGAEGDDRLFAAGGDDTLYGDAGNDTLNGGPGSDVYFIDDLGDRVGESRRWEGTDLVYSSVDFRMGSAHIENLTLTGEAYLGAGNGLNNQIVGTSGDNLLDGGRGQDRLVGGDGNDIYIIRHARDSAVEYEGGGIDTVKSYIPVFQAVYDIEKVYLQTTITKNGTPLQDMTAIGNSKANTLVGNPYDNSLIGREGHDTLRGQGGDDTFVFDEALIDANVKTIVDFNTNAAEEADMIMLKSWELGVVTQRHGLELDYFYDEGLIDPTTFVAAATAQSETDRFIFDHASGRLWFDPDGTGAVNAQLIALFENGADLGADSILLY